MNEKICSKYKKCPIFQGSSDATLVAEGVYQQLYCKAGSEKYTTCKRYLVSEAVKKPVPLDVMPNSFSTVQEIIDMMQIKGLLD